MFEDWTNCQVCEHNPTGDKCELFGRVIGMHGCSSGVERKPRTNGDKIRAMTDEELAEWSGEFFGCHPAASREICKKYADCAACWLDYLKQEVS